MSQFFQIHPENPQPRLIRQAAQIVQSGGVIAYPTDSSYALGCALGDKTAMTRIQTIRQTDKHHNFTLVCSDLSDISLYARLDNSQFRLLKSATPGPFTFILQATHEVPRRLQNGKRRTIGIRIPDNAIVRALLDVLGEPIMSSTLILPATDADQDVILPMSDPEDIRETLEHQLDLVIDGGYCPQQPTTVLDLTEGAPKLLRQGSGDASPFL